MKDRITQAELDDHRTHAESGYGIPGEAGSYEMMRILDYIEELQEQNESMRCLLLEQLQAIREGLGLDQIEKAEESAANAPQQ